MGHYLFVKGAYPDIPPTPKGKLIMSEKCYTILKYLYLIGGKGDSKMLFNAISLEDKEKFNIHNPEFIRVFIRTKTGYLSPTKEQGQKYMDYYGGKYTKVYKLKQRVIDFFDRELKNVDSQ